MRVIEKFARRITGFRNDSRGVAAIEFALAAPLLLLLLIGSVELTSGLNAKGKLTRATESIGDLIAQTEVLDAASFTDATDAGPAMMFPLPGTNFGVNVMSVIVCFEDQLDPTSDRKYYVTWSERRGISAGPLPGAGEEFTAIDEQISLGHGQTLIVTEAIYKFEPAIARAAGTEFDLLGRALHLPRATDRINFDDVEPSPIRSCDDYLS